MLSWHQVPAAKMDTQLLATSGVHVLFLVRARAAWPVDFTQWSWKFPCGRPSAIWLSRPPPGSCWSVWTIRRIDNRSYSLVRHLPNSSPPAAPPKFWPGSLLSPQPSWWPSPSARRRRWQQRWHLVPRHPDFRHEQRCHFLQWPPGDHAGSDAATAGPRRRAEPPSEHANC